MTEEQNKLAFDDWCKELAAIVGPALLVLDGELRLRRSIDLEAFYKRNCAEREPKTKLSGRKLDDVWPFNRPLCVEREPATEAVLEEPCRYCNAQGNDPCAYPEGCKRLDNLVLRMLNTAIHSDIKHPPAGSLLREAVRAIRKLALKGKGASQGAQQA